MNNVAAIFALQAVTVEQSSVGSKEGLPVRVIRHCGRAAKNGENVDVTRVSPLNLLDLLGETSVDPLETIYESSGVKFGAVR